MDTQRHRTLFNQYLRGTLSPEELPALAHFVTDERNSLEVDQWLQQAFRDPELRETADETIEVAYASLLARIQSESRKSASFWRPQRSRWWGLAAAVVVMIAVGTWLVQNPGPVTGGAMITPGGNRATLTLTDGRTIDLSTEQTGIIVGDGITYLDGSSVLALRDESQESRDSHAGNLGANVLPLMSIMTPKGGTYQITLPDGSKVWLNAISTLKYPSRFTEDERIVELSGEAYFEVKRMTSSKKLARELSGASLVPFLVKTQSQTVEVLGTQFNISAYPDDPETKTTLVEGTVNVSVNGSTPDRPQTTDHQPPITLKPGEQATVIAKELTKTNVDIYPYVAWKDNDFVFRNEPLPNVMRQLSRWYDVEVAYAPDAPMDLKIGGMVSRYDNIHTLLGIMAETGKVNFNVKGKQITVTK